MLYNGRSYEAFRRNIIYRKDQILNTLGVKIEWSPQADEDMKGIYDYIKNNLNEPQIAINIAKKISGITKKLQFFYKIYPTISFEKALRPIQKIKVKRYYIFYTFYEEKNTVYILRILHEKRDWNKILNF